MSSDQVTLLKIQDARERVKGVALRTPLLPAAQLSARTGAEVHLKLEGLQPTGSFKLRGAANKLAGLAEEARTRGVITVSTGNHGRAVAYAARALGIPVVVCLAEGVPENKLEAIRRLGARVVVAGETFDEAVERSLALQEREGLTFVHPFDDPEVIAGQGTIGLELLDELPKVDLVLVPLSGGGLISGVALALKAVRPEIRVIGVSMQAAPVMYHSLRAGRPLALPEEPTLADALVGGLGPANQYTFRMVQDLVDETLLVSEEEIASAMAFALKRLKLVVEGGGAVGIAALLHRRLEAPGRTLAVVVSGSNVDLDTLFEIAHGRS